MAKLHRFLKLNDRFDSQVFTFALPSKLLTEASPDTYIKDIIYGHHKWTASFLRTDRHLGCFLKLQTISTGMKVQIDFSFTLLNKEHFTRNESFIEKSCSFTSDSNEHGRKTFVGLSDLLQRDFMQLSGEFLMELEMRKINCVFECFIRVPRESQSRYSYETRLESPYFSFGLFDWSVSLIPSEGSADQNESIALQLHRHTSFDHLCNVRYFISLGENGAFQSEELDQLVDIAGNGDVYIINNSLHNIVRGRSTMKMKITMATVVSISEVSLDIVTRSKNRAHFYDRDKQAWLMEADTSGKYLAFKLYYTDITHVPRKYSRYVCWNIVVLTRYVPDHAIKTNFGPFSRYYVQQDLDDGYFIKTNIPVEKLQDSDCLYTEPDDPRLTVHVEWVESHLLATPTYHAFDDTDKLQKHQMKRELMALQAENLVLEKQLHSYQQSMSKAPSPVKRQDRDELTERVKQEILHEKVTEKIQERIDRGQMKRRDRSREGSSDRNDRPHDRSHDRLDRANERAYDKSYDRSYDKSYNKVYDKPYDKSYDKTYDKSYNKTYTSKTNDKAYDKQYDKQYDKSYDRAYDRSYRNK